VAVPVRGGAPAARLDLLLPPPLQRPLPIPPRAVSKISALPFPLTFAVAVVVVDAEADFDAASLFHQLHFGVPCTKWCRI